MDSDDGDDNDAEHSLFVCILLFIVVCFVSVPEYMRVYTQKPRAQNNSPALLIADLLRLSFLFFFSFFIFVVSNKY